MGSVFRAYDSVRQGQVALKTMHRLDPVGIYALKNEFRALQDVHHPNLVQLFELFREGDQWFFTMELIAGEPIDRWVRSEDRLDERRLRSAFGQLIDAILAVHASGRLHRDIKPSNVLVDAAGHVTVLDFGLVTDPNAEAIGQTVTDQSVVGTPAYLAPEQGHGRRASTASDVYALGVMLYEALIGKLPFDGTCAEVLVAKQESIPVWPRALRRSAPEDLVRLCDRILSRDPAARPELSAVRAHFGVDSQELPAPSQPPRSPLAAAELIGRSDELARMREAYHASVGGRAVVLSVSGESGIGKTAVCDAFLETLVREDHAVVLRGRCNERESVPFKAFDALIDSLTRHLRRLRPVDAASLLPRDAAALATLFPVLGRIESFAHAPVRSPAEPHERQRRAFAALHELLGRMRDRAPLVIYIDDLQWTDRDSSQLLCSLILHAELLPVLLILSHRSDPASQSELLDSVLDAARSNRELLCRELVLAPLSAAASVALAERALSEARPDVHALGERIGLEAGGNPFLIGEFARYAAHAGELDPENLTLGGALTARVAELSAPARELLAVLALAGQPLPVSLALEAASATHEDVDALGAKNLLRWSLGPNEKTLEFYHDRIRETFRNFIPEAGTERLYAALSRACHGRPEIEADMRCAYLEGAGDPAGAAACAAEAAEQAAAALAFDHAARLFQKAVELGAYSVQTGLHLTSSWASALANSGRSEQAAAAYKRAALLASGDVNLDLLRRSAEQLLIAGHAESGISLIEEVCHDAGLKLPTESRLGNLGLMLALRKLKFTGSVPRRLFPGSNRRSALRLDLLQTAVVGMQCYAQAGATRTAVDYLVEARRAGDVRHTVWALGSLAIHLESRSYPELFEQMQELAERDGRPELRGLVHGMRGFLARRSGKNAEARPWFAKALACYRECVGMQWQIDMMHVHDQASAAACGAFADLTRTTPALVEDAFQRGRVWTGATLSGFWGMPAWLARSDTHGYRRQLERARSRWQRHASFLSLDRTTYGLQRAEIMLALYEGDVREALRLVGLHDSVPMKVSHLRVHEFVRAQCGVAALGARALGASESVAVRAFVQRTIAQLRSASTQPFAHIFTAALAQERGELALAVRELNAAIELFDLTDARMSAAACRRRLGQLVGGEDGRSLIAAGDAFMTEQGVLDREAWTELLTPGCGRCA